MKEHVETNKIQIHQDLPYRHSESNLAEEIEVHSFDFAPLIRP